jgi:hypothetical protein
MPRSLARLSASASSHRDLFSVVFITNIAESDFRYTHLHASNERDFDTVVTTLDQLRVGALVISADPSFTGRIEQLTVRHAVPASYPLREFALAAV